LLGVQQTDCLVFEDAPKGVESAANAKMSAIVITTTHEASEFAEYANVIAFVKDYSTLTIG
jgi:beta-phosphoglucomutase